MISVEEARAIDRDAVERLGMPSILLMENAARGVAVYARQLGARFVVLCGPGNNGGDGLAAARHLGPSCGVHLFGDPDPRRVPDAAVNLRILRAAGRRIESAAPIGLDDPDLVWIDALFGTGLTREPRGIAAEWIALMNRARGPKLSVDVPSGLCADRGIALGAACVRADHTVTFEAVKCGMVASGARAFVGAIHVVPLGLP